MNDLVERKLKKLHYFPPNFRVQPPHSILAAHPLLAGIPKAAFRSEVGRPPHGFWKSVGLKLVKDTLRVSDLHPHPGNWEATQETLSLVQRFSLKPLRKLTRRNVGPGEPSSDLLSLCRCCGTGSCSCS